LYTSSLDGVEWSASHSSGHLHWADYISLCWDIYMLQGKGLMDTYWLTCKDGGITRSADFDVPTLFDDDQPMFIRRLREEYYIWYSSLPSVPESSTSRNSSLVPHPLGDTVTNGHTLCSKPVALNKNVNLQCSASTLESVPLSPVRKKVFQDPS